MHHTHADEPVVPFVDRPFWIVAGSTTKLRPGTFMTPVGPPGEIEKIERWIQAASSCLQTFLRNDRRLLASLVYKMTLSYPEPLLVLEERVPHPFGHTWRLIIPSIPCAHRQVEYLLFRASDNNDTSSPEHALHLDPPTRMFNLIRTLSDENASKPEIMRRIFDQ
ncbi:MAG: hypothetical protein V4674_00620 [Patescibacteria group bacterium]